MAPVRRSRSMTSAACSRTLTRGAWMCCRLSSASGRGSSALAASWANWSRPIPMSTSGSRLANRSSSPTARGCRRDSPASRVASTPATCLKARYCRSRANRRSRASSSARSSSSSTSPCGSSRAALRSSSVAATSRNDEVCSRSHSPLTSPSSRADAPALTCAMNSSVTCESETSVMSSLCLEIRLSSRSNGPSKLSRRSSNVASNAASGASSVRGSGHPSLSRRTRALLSPLSSRSARTSETASRRSRPRSTARPCLLRSDSRACSMSNSSWEVT